MSTSLDRLSEICLGFAEAGRIDQGLHARFVIRKRTFGYYLHNHHGDGMVAAAFKALPGENEELTERFPDRYHLPPYIGPKGWVAIRLDLDRVDWDEVSERAGVSYRLVAPKRLWPARK